MDAEKYLNELDENTGEVVELLKVAVFRNFNSKKKAAGTFLKSQSTFSLLKSGLQVTVCTAEKKAEQTNLLGQEKLSRILIGMRSGKFRRPKILFRLEILKKHWFLKKNSGSNVN